MLAARSIVLGLAALLIVTAGCLSLGQGDEQVQQTRAEVAYATDDTGGLEGVVTDEAVETLGGVMVTLVEVDRSTESLEDGTYAFSEVEPGTHTVRVDGEGFHATEGTVEVFAGEVTTRDFVLSRVTGDEAFMTTNELEGFFECGAEVGWNVTHEAPEPPEQAPFDPRYFYLGWAVCAEPNSLLDEVGEGGNATNDRFSHLFELDPVLDTLVYEMVWESENRLSEWMTTRMEVEGFANDGIGTIFRTQGPSPIQERIDRGDWDELEEAFQEACEEGADAYCGYNWEIDGYPLQTRVFPAWQCASEDGGGCAVVQQSFTNYVSAFYNQPAPEGYSILEG